MKSSAQVFTYTSDFDDNGILYWIGTNGRYYIVLFQHSKMCKRCLQHEECRIKFFELLVLTWLTRLPFKLGEPGSILGWTSTQGLKIIEERESYHY